MGIMPEIVGEAINLASKTETRIVDLASMINEITGNKAGIALQIAKRLGQGNKEEALRQVLERYRGKGERYDYLVPISGGRVSSFTLHEMVRKYEMRALALTVDSGGKRIIQILLGKVPKSRYDPLE
jgi:nucleoside-diphosphate-sugar epimerase